MKNEPVTAQSQFGFSFLRILATFSVIIIHVSALLVVRYGKITNFDWHVANFYDGISRYSVPMFFMLSGALLLNKDYELRDFLKKRFSKIIIPFLVWSLLYSVLNRYVFKDEIFNLFKITRDIFYGSEYHLWFVFVLLGIYITVPILRKWIRQAPQKEIRYFLSIWIITLFLTIPNFKIYFSKVDFTFFSGFIGYFILGYYLSLIKFKKIISVLLIILGASITIFGTYYFTIKDDKFYSYFYEYLCINALMVSTGIFTLFNKLQCFNLSVTKLVNNLNASCFGIYLLHPLMLKLFKMIGFDVEIATPAISIFVVGFACFFLCFILVYFIKKVRYGNYIVG